MSPYSPSSCRFIPAALEVPGHHIGHSYVHAALTEHGQWKSAVRAYLAASAHMDHQLGRVLDALEESKYAGNTAIFLCGDHGYHLGEKEHWTKFGLWEKTNRVPLMISMPGAAQQFIPNFRICAARSFCSGRSTRRSKSSEVWSCMQHPISCFQVLEV